MFLFDFVAAMTLKSLMMYLCHNAAIVAINKTI